MHQYTLCLVKSHVVAARRTDEVLAAIQFEGFTVVSDRCNIAMNAGIFEGVRMFEKLYSEHHGKPYYEGLIRSVTMPVFALPLILSGEDVISRFRASLGSTNPQNAAPGSLRGRFGIGLPDNAFHGSDSEDAAAREIAIFFPQWNKFNLSRPLAGGGGAAHN